jgi:hypothetical protein
MLGLKGAKVNMNSLEELYEKALAEIKGQPGVITINIGGIPKTSHSNDIIGNCVQEWIPQWLEDNGIKLEKGEHSQQFPDFTAIIDGERHDMEVKCWNYQNAPAFDIANFDGFYREIFADPSKLYAKYLIFGYTPTKHGFQIDNIYLKNIWEITSRTDKYPVNLQNKQGRPYAIRPFPFHKSPNKSFSDIHQFVQAIHETRKMFPQPEGIDPETWFEAVTNGLL